MRKITAIRIYHLQFLKVYCFWVYMKYIQIDLRTLALTCFNVMILTNKEKRENKVTMYVFCELLFFVIVHSYHKIKIGYRIYDFYLIRTSLVLRIMMLLQCLYILCLITHGILPYLFSFPLLLCACVENNNDGSN